MCSFDDVGLGFVSVWVKVFVCFVIVVLALFAYCRLALSLWFGLDLFWVCLYLVLFVVLVFSG